MLLLLPALLLTLSVAASEPHPLAIEALDDLDSFDDASWSYTKTTTSGEGVKVERHDAERPEGDRWVLLEINGRTPTPREREKYRQEKTEELERRADEKEKDENDVDRKSIRLVEQTAERAIFNFRTKIDGRMGGKLEENILGTLVVNKDGAWAERFELENTGKLSPIPGVNISRFNIRMTFQKHLETGEIVPDEIEMQMRGRAFLVKSLDEDRSSRFSDFERVR